MLHTFLLATAAKTLITMGLMSFLEMLPKKKLYIAPLPVIARINNAYIVFRPKAGGLIRLRYYYVPSHQFDNYILAQRHVIDEFDPEYFVYFGKDGGHVYGKNLNNGNLSGVSYKKLELV